MYCRNPFVIVNFLCESIGTCIAVLSSIYFRPTPHMYLRILYFYCYLYFLLVCLKFATLTFV